MSCSAPTNAALCSLQQHLPRCWSFGSTMWFLPSIPTHSQRVSRQCLKHGRPRQARKCRAPGSRQPVPTYAIHFWRAEVAAAAILSAFVPHPRAAGHSVLPWECLAVLVAALSCLAYRWHWCLWRTENSRSDLLYRTRHVPHACTRHKLLTTCEPGQEIGPGCMPRGKLPLAMISRSD